MSAETHTHEPQLPSHVARSVEAMAGLHAGEELRVGPQQRAIETLTADLGRPRTLYAIVALVLGWIGGNLIGLRLHGTAVDPPPFYWLQGVVTLSSLLTSTIVLITQNRQGRLADRRQRLDLQVNLQSEQRTAKLIALVEELRRDLPNVRDRRDSEAEALAVRTDPIEVATALEVALEAATTAAADENEEGR